MITPRKQISSSYSLPYRKSSVRCGHKLKDLTLPPETLIVLIRRGEQNIIPDGETIILQNDVLVLSAITPDEVHGIKLVEKIIEKDSRYNNKLLSEISKNTMRL